MFYHFIFIKNYHFILKFLLNCFVSYKTLKKYMKYIENMFKSNITNGLIEGLNNKIKSIKRTAFGYSNFSNFKKRILIQAGIISISA
ncbi:hypothetical protein RN96_07300 [Fusobacterium polymorphum]|uniref:Transposase IS204/IS1001/IS1096/IS1165 DDE domain-containing protein n=1 Tax=Fusobacterium nucleatum subsp. polymorphum TaxID=76857 RepID=A0A2B7Y9Z0_FUSNP|nr:hypothetical protein RN96_07300 [Fusobacterium polymorphum]